MLTIVSLSHGSAPDDRAHDRWRGVVATSAPHWPLSWSASSSCWSWRYSHAPLPA